MKFRTEIEVGKSELNIKHSDKILTIGSCFADNIGEKFTELKFQIMKNPFGVLYNPVSIYNSVDLALSKKVFTENDLIFHQSEFHSFYHHSDFSHHEKDIILEKINSGIEQTHEFLQNADLAIFTFGTAFVYKHLEKGIVVSNNHKLPGNQFERRRLSLNEATQFIGKTLRKIKEVNPNIKFVLTVSPVRHWKDGAIENQRSKATLILAIDKIVQECKDVFYFPSYELLLDDLRDYRFFASDLVHPSDEAVEYIWEKFSQMYFEDKTNELIKKIEKIVRAKNHIVRNAESEESKKFEANLKSQIKEIEKLYDYIKF